MFSRIQNIIATQLNIPKERITPKTRVLEDLSADSLDMIEMVTQMESEFQISITDDQIAKMQTVQDIVDFCVKLDAKK